MKKEKYELLVKTTKELFNLHPDDEFDSIFEIMDCCRGRSREPDLYRHICEILAERFARVLDEESNIGI